MSDRRRPALVCPASSVTPFFPPPSNRHTSPAPPSFSAVSLSLFLASYTSTPALSPLPPHGSHATVRVLWHAAGCSVVCEYLAIPAATAARPAARSAAVPPSYARHEGQPRVCDERGQCGQWSVGECDHSSDLVVKGGM